MKKTISILLVSFLPLCAWAVSAAEGPQEKGKEKEKKESFSEKPGDEGKLKSSTFAGLKLRGIGPALMSGRISDIAVDPEDRSTWYVAAASGGVWKTRNAGVTWKPVFDGQGSYSIGCVAVDAKDHLTVWVGTGENNSQRSVGFGDGVYKSVDGGKSWKRAGLEHSEHIAKIVIDPRDHDTVYVAAQGPLWAPGGDRGLYKTTDGGETWKLLLSISENTGVTDVVLDPRDPDVIFAAAYQRRRHVFTLIDGGPESAVYKSTDGGASWNKVTRGLPSGDVGRIGLAVSPQNPDVVYAVVEASGKGSGFYRSADGGSSWKKMSSYLPSSPQYYQEIFADPFVFDRVYSMDVLIKVTGDGGRTFRSLGEKAKHVDNHALVFDPGDPGHLIAGCDGGVYETFDHGANWLFKANLPVTQFYKLCVDNDLPFYNVYGGTQDNNTQGGPSRTRNRIGITNRDWFVTLGGDGFKPQVDPEDPDTVYSQLQYGVLVRYDRRTGERIDIQPQPDEGEEPLKWNWDSPLMISPHSHTRLYFAAQRIFRSDDRGDSWRPVSPDLTRKIDRNTLEVMGRVWSVDAVAKSESTSFYGNIVSLAESPIAEGLLYAGTDDGLIQVSGDGGASWRRIDTFPGVPEMTYVSDIEASRLDADTVFAAFNNHKRGDFKPYVLKSPDRGRTWTSIAGDLPERGPVWALAQDHVRKDLLFAGTEFGLFFTIDGGKRWIRLKGGLPTIPFRDLEIQRRESDLAGASFGRGFFILDDYSPLRLVTEDLLEKEAFLFPVKKALMYVPASSPAGGAQGGAFFSAPNPPFGAVFTYYLEEGLKTRKEKRKEREKKIAKEGGVIPYPSWDELRAEDREEPPEILLTVTDEEGNTVRKISGPASGGFHRVAWDLRYPASTPVSAGGGGGRGSGPPASPGVYRVSLAKKVDGEVTPLCGPVTFEAVPLGASSLSREDGAALLAFEKKTGRLQRAVLGSIEAIKEARKNIASIKKALENTLDADPDLGRTARDLENRLDDLDRELSGDKTISKRHEPVPPSILNRVQRIVRGHWSTTSAPTATHRRNFEIAAKEFGPCLEKLRVLVEKDLKALEDRMEEAGAPWTPGRVPRWKPEPSGSGSGGK